MNLISFCFVVPHATFQNPRTTPSVRKVKDEKERDGEIKKKIGNNNFVDRLIYLGLRLSDL